MSQVSYALAFFLGAFLQCILYGVFCCLLIGACYVQWEKRQRGKELNPVMAFATIFFALTLTTNCILQLIRAIGVILYRPPGVTVHQALDPPYPNVEIALWGIFQFQIVVADAIMVYRMYHIYNGNAFVCIIPSITTIGLFVIGCALTNQLRDLTTPSAVKAQDRWDAACFCLTLFNSVFTTFAISLKLWLVHRATVKAGVQTEGSIVLRSMKILIESAALWTTFVALNFFSFLAKSDLAYTFLAMTGPAVGISFCLIIVRLGRTLPEAQDETWHISFHTPASQVATTDQVAVSFTQAKALQDVHVNESTSFPMRSVKSSQERDI